MFSRPRVKMAKGKLFRGAPFGTQKTRFDISAVHPQSKMPGTFTEVPYCRIATSRESRLRGPGMYDINSGDFTERAINIKSAGANWRKGYESARMSAIPHMLYKDEWERKRQLIDQLGPGRYYIKDFIETLDSRPSSTRSVCQTTGLRLRPENKFQASLPGPGTYGDGGIPSLKLEQKAKQSFCTVGVMEGGVGRMQNTNEELSGSELAPGTYTLTNSIQRLVDKQTSTRGPYDLYSGDRIPTNKRDITTTHLAPGKFEILPFTAILHDRYHIKNGQFSSLAQYPQPPTERIYCNTLSQWPRNEKDPGPGYYSYNRKTAISSAPNRYPFNSTTTRLKKPAKSTTRAGPGQYDINRWARVQHRNCNENVFISGKPRLPYNICSEQEQLLNEKTHPKHVFEQQNIPMAPVETATAFEGART